MGQFHPRGRVLIVLHISQPRGCSKFYIPSFAPARVKTNDALEVSTTFFFLYLKRKTIAARVRLIRRKM